MFENINEAKDIIRTRTSKIIGGYITESLFVKEFKKVYPGRLYSKGWWGGTERNNEKNLVFFVVKSVLSELDLKVIERLEKYNYQWFQLYNEDDVWYMQNRTSRMTIDKYVSSRKLIPCRDPSFKPQKKNDPYLEKCIEIYENEGMVRDIASSIYIEDHFLNLYFVISNIDLICEFEEDIPSYVEIKFKNEFTHKTSNDFQQLVFGIDDFQYNSLFAPFLKSGMEIRNIVLYNDVKNQNNVDTTVITEFLKEKDSKDYLWKTKTIPLNSNFEKHTFSSGKTGWSGFSERTVYCIPLKEYVDFGQSTLSDKQKKWHQSGSWGKCPVCGYQLVIRASKEREFKGVDNMSNVNELLEVAIKETEYLNESEVFLVKDLFKGYAWNRIPRKDRLLLGTLFLNWVNKTDSDIKAIEKTSSNQQRYKKTCVRCGDE